MEKKTKKILLGIFALLLLIGISSAGALYYYLFAPQFHPEKITYIYIDRDDTADSLYNQVKSKGHPKHFTGFLWMAKFRKLPLNIHTGRYAIRPGDNVYHVFNRLYRGYQEPMNLTIASVRTIDRLARSVGNQLMIDSAEIAQKMNDSVFQQKLGYKKETMACLFIPETYQVYWDMSVEAFFDRMQKEHQKFWNRERLDKATAIGMTPEEICTLASIVEEETNNNPEKPMVAGLYLNRLHKDMALQADPTIKFALQDFGLRRITNAHLTIDSPYNTYQNLGLPPGPIRVPSPIGLDAVLNYTKHDYLYMCAKEDFSGTHNFASNYSDHMKNARKYWNALNERKIFK
ncbi:endolytic transglycosylase MltG [uncultured Bacteroides sp.]|uniref:endolytic transglycosylase MltG n=1 Tax=uncultured Bacteroides sp. TaxID=162156 RepID=UPI002635FF58|nr:endolytic transglycosylase MltG [uncultured Bacteroides sp.]